MKEIHARPAMLQNQYEWFFLDAYELGKNNPFKCVHAFYLTLRHVSLIYSFWFYEIRPLNMSFAIGLLNYPVLKLSKYQTQPYRGLLPTLTNQNFNLSKCKISYNFEIGVTMRLELGVFRFSFVRKKIIFRSFSRERLGRIFRSFFRERLGRKSRLFLM